MKIGLIDVDNWGKLDNPKTFPNLAIMLLSSHHKMRGDSTEWYNENSYYDVVYMSKVFTFTEDIPEPQNTNKVVKGGSGYDIKVINGIEVYKSGNKLPDFMYHLYPDYSLYNTNKAYGFLTRGCPRGCGFCHVKSMQGLKPHRVSYLSDFWHGQNEIVLLDPNILSYKNWREILQELIDSGAFIDFCQGLDIRFMTKDKAEMLKKVKVKRIHFAWDNYNDKELVTLKLKEFVDTTGWGRNKLSCYVLTNFDTTLEQDLERVYFLRSLNIQPYVMRYDKEHIPRGDLQNALARWVNFVPLFWKYDTFEDYLENRNK